MPDCKFVSTAGNSGIPAFIEEFQGVLFPNCELNLMIWVVESHLSGLIFGIIARLIRKCSENEKEAQILFTENLNHSDVVGARGGDRTSGQTRNEDTIIEHHSQTRTLRFE